MAKTSNDERLFPLYIFPTAFIFLLVSALIGAEVFFRYADPPNRFPAILEADETLSYKLKNGSTGRFVSANGLVDVEMEINARGLRDREILYEKPWNTTRILALGGAATFGWGLPLEETFPKLLEKQLADQANSTKKNFEVINGGVPGYTLSQSLKQYETELNKYSPDWVVLFLDADLSFDSINLHTLKKGTIKERPVPPYEVSFYCSSLLEKVHFLYPLCKDENRFFPAERNDDSNIHHTKRAEELETALLQQLATACIKNGAKLLVVVPDNVPRSTGNIATIAKTLPFPSLSVKQNYTKTRYLAKEEITYLTEKLFIFFKNL